MDAQINRIKHLSEMLVIYCVMHIQVPSTLGLKRHQKYLCIGKIFVGYKHTFLNISRYISNKYLCLSSQALQIKSATKRFPFLKKNNSSIIINYNYLLLELIRNKGHYEKCSPLNHHRLSNKKEVIVNSLYRGIQ